MKTVIKELIPKWFMRFYINIKNRNKSPEEIFTEIYNKNLWGKAQDGRQYCSGFGTEDPNVEKYIEILRNFINEFEIKSIFEIGCGDFTVMKSVLSHSDIRYTGSDIVKSLIEYLNASYSNENVKFIHMDAVNSEKYPIADLCIIRQVMQHLSNAQISEIIGKSKKYKFVIITEHVPVNPKHKNDDKITSGYIRMQNHNTSGVFLDAFPFSLNCKVLLSYQQDDKDYYGNRIPAVMMTSLIVNNIN
ncbi:MAG: class I SAM-dependent methyltransferase [Bacteroidales bacterium]|nr:class I SAM-dependent methyltransferase [Bacteroidales bacterium]